MKAIKAYTSTLEVIKMGVLVCINMTRTYLQSKGKQGAALVPIIWGGVGLGKSQLWGQVSKQIDMELVDIRTSDKDPTDIGGLPCPDTDKGQVRYLQSSQMERVLKQFDSKGNYIPKKRKGCILLWDEKDRSTTEVQNATLQLDLDRCINGRELDDDVYVVGAGNADSDMGTTPLSSAAATRLIHFYVDSTSSAAVKGWQNWATDQGLPSWSIAFADYRKEIFCGEEVEYTEITKCTPRTFVWAIKLIEECHKIGGYATRPEVIKSLVYGTIGSVAGQEALAFRKLKESVPDADKIIADPEGVSVPNGADSFGILYIATQHLVDYAYADGKEDTEATRAFVKYANRWPDECKGAFFNAALHRGLKVAGLEEFKSWDEERKAA